MCRGKERKIVDIKKEVKRGLEAPRLVWSEGGREGGMRGSGLYGGGMEMVNPFLRIYPRNE